MIAGYLPVLIGYVDRARRLSFASRKREAIYGIPHRQVTGVSAEDVLGPAAYAQGRPYIDAALSGKAVHFARMVHGPDGERWEEVGYVPDLQPDGANAGFFLMVDDITPSARPRRRWYGATPTTTS
jgi:PAS domain S-box-containing protein